MTPAAALRSIVTATADGSSIALIVSPRAGKTAIAGVSAEGLRLRVAAPPVEGAANAAIVRFLADMLDVPTSRVRLTQGERSRRKRVAIADLSADDAIARLASLLPD